MAMMFPSDVDGFTTAGEAFFYGLLQNILLPDSDFLAWYEPRINGTLEPDFVVYSPDSGLLVFEVKDWVIEQVLEANPKQVTLNINGRAESRKNPEAQARDYVYALMRHLGQDRELHSTHGHYAGKLGLPITGGIVLSNITRQAFLDAGLDAVIPANRTLFLDDIHPDSPLHNDSTGHNLRGFLREAFPPLFPFQFPRSRVERLRFSLFPNLKIHTPRHDPALAQADEHVAILDRRQEQLARSFHSGQRLIRGPSGSGKTLILTHQVGHLLQKNPTIRRVLVTCFNLSLRNYIHRLLAAQQVPYGPDAVEVLPFYDLCGRILGEKVVHSEEKADYYQLVVDEALSIVRDAAQGGKWQGHYDAILVDEGQDFTQDMAEILRFLLRPRDGVMTIAQDEDQSLYTPGSVWQQCLPDLKAHDLRSNHRNSVQISRFVRERLGLAADRYEFIGPSGPEPEEHSFADMNQLYDFVRDQVAQLVRDGCAMADIAVLYASRHYGGCDDVPRLLLQTLEQQGLLVTWLSENTHAKRRYDITTDTITLSTIHSVKGMDYAHVFLIGLPPFTADKNAGRKGDKRGGYAEKLAYVGMTRARFGLYLCEVEGEYKQTSSGTPYPARSGLR